MTFSHWFNERKLEEKTMKKLILGMVAMGSFSSFASIGVYHYCTSDVGTWVANAAISQCFSNLSSKVADIVCREDHKRLFPDEADIGVKNGVYAVSFYSKKDCKSVREDDIVRELGDDPRLYKEVEVRGRNYLTREH